MKKKKSENLAVADATERLIDKGNRELALATFLSETVKVSLDEVGIVKSRSCWPELVKTHELGRQ